jgi:hypothetical protein
VNRADRSYEHLQRRLAALPRSPVQPRLRAQNDFRRAASLEPGFALPVTGAFSLLPVMRLYFALPLAVSPPPCLTDSFSPRETLRLGPRLRATIQDRIRGVPMVGRAT